MEAYCVKCHTKREMANPESVTMRSGKSAVQGFCPKCGTKMFKIGARLKRTPEIRRNRKSKYPEPERLLYR